MERVSGVFDIAHIKAIHKNLFDGVYPDAGEFRTVRAYNGWDEFTRPEQITMSLRLVCDYTKMENYFRGLPQDMLAAKLCAAMGKLHRIHPFQDGNRRVYLTFLEQLAANAGFEFDISKLPKDDMTLALSQALIGNYMRMLGLFTPALTYTGVMGSVVYNAEPAPEKPRKGLFHIFKRRTR